MTSELSLRGSQSIMLNPADVVANATIQAKLLMDIVEKTHCFQLIAKKKYLQVEAWETIGAFNRVHAVTESVNPIKKDDDIVVGYDAKVNLVNQDGLVVGSAIMPCYFTENACKGKEGDAKDKACKSAAQTFATSKAYRMNFSYVAILAGYEPTPAEEITGEDTLGGVKPDVKQEHWCAEHNTAFFKKGAMKGYAHPIEGTKEWHNELEPVIVEAPPTPPAEPTKVEVPLIDETWLKESLDTLQWTDVALYLKSHYKVAGKTVREAVGKLTKEQSADFVKVVQERLELSGKAS